MSLRSTVWSLNTSSELLSFNVCVGVCVCVCVCVCVFCIQQHALRLMAFGQIYKVLEMEPLPSNKPSQKYPWSDKEGVYTCVTACLPVYLNISVCLWLSVYALGLHVSILHTVWRPVVLGLSALLTPVFRVAHDVTFGFSTRQRWQHCQYCWLVKHHKNDEIWCFFDIFPPFLLFFFSVSVSVKSC